MKRLAFIGAVLLLPSLCLATQPTVTSTYNGTGTTGTTATISSVACSGSDTALFIGTGGAGGSQPTGVTFGAASAVSVASEDFGGVSLGQIWRVLSPSGTDTITATWAASQTAGAAVTAICLDNVHQTTPTGTPVTGESNGTAISGQSVSGDSGNDLVLDLVSWSAGGGATITADVGTTERTTLNPYGGWAFNFGTHASGTSQSPTWTISTSQDWTHIVVNVAGTAGDGVNTQFFKRRIQ